MVKNREPIRSHFNELSVLPPKPFNATAPERWQQWLARFEQYLAITNMENKRDSIKCALLCEAVGKSAAKQVRPNPEKPVTYRELKMRFAHHFNVVSNVDFQRAIFKARRRRAGESVEAFVDALCSLAETCDFGPYKADVVKDRLACNIGDKRVQRCIRVLGIQNISLAKIVEIARLTEAQDLVGTMADFSQQHPPRVRRYTMERKKFEFKLYDDSWNLPADEDEKKTASSQIQKQMRIVAIQKVAPTAQIEKGVTTDQDKKDVTIDQIQKVVTTAQIEKEVTTDQIQKVVTTAQIKKEVATDQIKEDVTTDQITEDVTTDQIQKVVTTAQIEKEVATDLIEEDKTTVQIEKQVVTYQVEKNMTTNEIQKEVAMAQIEREVPIDQIQKVTTTAQIEKEMTIDQVKKKVTTDQIQKAVTTAQIEREVATDQIEEDVTTVQIEKQVATYQVKNKMKDVQIEKMKSDQIKEMNTDLIEEVKTDQFEELKTDQIEEVSSKKIKKVTFNKHTKKVATDQQKKKTMNHIKRVTNHIKKNVSDKLKNKLVIHQLKKKMKTHKIDKRAIADKINKKKVAILKAQNKVISDQIEKEMTTDQVKKKVTTDQIQKVVTTAQIEKEMATDQIEEDVTANQIQKVVTTAQIEKEVATDQIEEDVTVNQIQKVVTTAQIEKEVATDQIEENNTTVQIEKQVVTYEVAIRNMTTNEMQKEVATAQIKWEVATDQIEEVSSKMIKKVTFDKHTKKGPTDQQKKKTIYHIKRVTNHIKKNVSDKLKNKLMIHQLKKNRTTDKIDKTAMADKINKKIVSILKAQNKVLNDQVRQVMTTTDLNLPNYLSDVHNALMRHASRGNLEVAEHLCVNWHTEMEKMGPPSTCAKMLALKFLGIYHRSEKNYDKAANAYKDLLAIQKKRIHPLHPELGKTFSTLGEILTSAKKHTQAELMWREALDIREKTVGRNDFGVVKEVSNVALALQNQGWHNYAEKYYVLALALYELNVEPHHPQISITRSKIKRCIQREKEVKKTYALPDRPRNPLKDTDQILDVYEELDTSQMNISSFSRI